MNAVFQALSDPTRREILRLLRKREMSAGEIAEQFALARSTLSGHFNILKNAGLIVAEKNGTTIVYSLNVSVVEQTMAAMLDLLDIGKPAKKEEAMKFSLRTEIPQLALIVAMFALAAWSWPRLPDQIPTHWNIQGQVDGHGNKFVGLLLLPFTVLGLYVLMMLLPLFDPGRANYRNFAGTYNVLRLGFVAFMAMFYAATVAAAFGRHIDMTSVAFLGTAVLFFVIGNVMGKIRPNWFVGVRTPWTLSSKLSWDKTHRLAGWLFLLMGAGFAVVAFVHNTWTFAAMVTFDAICLLWMVVYSYLVYRSDPHPTPPAGTSPSAD